MNPNEPYILDRLTRQSQSFVLRAWREDLGGSQLEWRAYVRHVLSGETRYIRSWQELEDFLEAFEERKPEHTPTHANGSS